MAVYQQSTLPFSSARSYVAAAGGSEGDVTMEVLAGRAVSAALERFANFWRWEHYFTVFSGYNGSAGSVLGSIGFTTNSSPAGNSALQITPSGTGAFSAVEARPPNAPGGYGFVADLGGLMFDMTWISFSDATGLMTLSTGLPVAIPQNAAGTFKQQGVILPSDVRDIYDVRLLRSGRVLTQMDQRAYDTARFQNSPGTTTHYGLFSHRNNASAGMSLFPPPVEDDQVMVRYYRRPVMPSASATVLDIPQDAEHSVLSLAKAYYLTDRGGNDSRMDSWRREGEMGLQELRARENQKPDLSTGLRPGYEAWGMKIGPNETWPYFVEG